MCEKEEPEQNKCENFEYHTIPWKSEFYTAAWNKFFVNYQKQLHLVAGTPQKEQKRGENLYIVSAVLLYNRLYRAHIEEVVK